MTDRRFDGIESPQHLQSEIMTGMVMHSGVDDWDVISKTLLDEDERYDFSHSILHDYRRGEVLSESELMQLIRVATAVIGIGMGMSRSGQTVEQEAESYCQSVFPRTASPV